MQGIGGGGLLEKIQKGACESLPGSKNVGPLLVIKKCWVQKKFGAKKIWVEKNFGCKKILGAKLCWVQKKLGAKKVWVQKKFCSKKI